MNKSAKTYLVYAILSLAITACLPNAPDNGGGGKNDGVFDPKTGTVEELKKALISASPEKKNEYMMEAIENGNEDVAIYLIDQPELEQNSMRIGVSSPIELALKKDTESKLAKKLIQKTRAGGKRDKALLLKFCIADYNYCKALLANGVELGAAPDILFNSIAYGDADMLKLLISNGANVNQAGSAESVASGRMPLFEAVMQADKGDNLQRIRFTKGIIEALIEAGANKKAQNPPSDKTAYEFAEEKGLAADIRDMLKP